MRQFIRVWLAAWCWQMGSSVAWCDPVDVRVMSFNIRYGTAKDGENHWDKRREFLIETIRTFDPDILGTQETLMFQKEYLAEHLKGYVWLGVGRDDGLSKGETVALGYRSARFEHRSSGHFWLSETPDVPGSRSWDTAITRMVSWVKLEDKLGKNRPQVLFLNTHFDHVGKVARLESARQIRKWIEEQGSGCDVVLTGDFNAGEGSEPYTALFGNPPESHSILRDTYRLIHREKQMNEGTYNNFREEGTAGARIDWIAISKGWTTKQAAIVRTARDGRTPSDHFPVTATLVR